MKRVFTFLAGLAILSTSPACSWQAINYKSAKRLLAAAASPSPAPLRRLAPPLVDLTAEGGSSAVGTTAHFKVSQVAIGGGVRRIPAQTPSGISVRAGAVVRR